MNRVLIKSVGPVSACALSLVVILGAPDAQGAQGPNCAQAKHHCLKVKVNATTNTLVVDPDTLTKKGPGHHMHWMLDSDSGPMYTFPSNGITFADDDGGTKQFKNCKPAPGNARIFNCDDPVGKKGTYKYTVRVSGNPQPPPLDPRIVNN